MRTHREESMSSTLSHARATTTVVDAARVLGISRNGAYAAVARGDIPSVRIGKRILVPTARLRALLEGAPRPNAAEDS